MNLVTGSHAEGSSAVGWRQMGMAGDAGRGGDGDSHLVAL